MLLPHKESLKIFEMSVFRPVPIADYCWIFNRYRDPCQEHSVPITLKLPRTCAAAIYCHAQSTCRSHDTLPKAGDHAREARLSEGGFRRVYLLIAPVEAYALLSKQHPHPWTKSSPLTATSHLFTVVK